MNYHYRRNNFDTLSVLYRLRDGGVPRGPLGPWGFLTRSLWRIEKGSELFLR